MPKTSGYPLARNQILTYIAENQPKEIDRATLAQLLGVSVSTAGNYMMILASTFPENLSYVRGLLIIKSILPEARLPPEIRLQSKQKQIQKVKDMVEQINSNHLSHNKLKEIREVLKKLKGEVANL
jgi:hypothetical protein